MIVKRFASNGAECRAFAAAVDAAFGYPRDEDPALGGFGVRHGGGRHVPWALVVTRHHAPIYLLGDDCAYPVDADVLALDGRPGVSIGQTEDIPLQGWELHPLPDAARPGGTGPGGDRGVGAAGVGR